MAAGARLVAFSRVFFLHKHCFLIFTKNSLQTLSALDCKFTVKKYKNFSLKLPFNKCTCLDGLPVTVVTQLQVVPDSINCVAWTFERIVLGLDAGLVR